MPIRKRPSEDGHESKKSESGGGISRSTPASEDIRETDLSPEEWREVALLLAGHITDLSSEEWREVALFFAGHIRETDLSPKEWREVVSLLPGQIRETDLSPEEGASPLSLGVSSLRSGSKSPHLDESISPDVTPEEAEVIARRFLSFDLFEEVDTDLSGEEKAGPSREEAANLKRLAGHFAQQAGEIKSLLYRAEANPEGEQSFIIQAARHACRTLKEVLEDENLRKGIKLLALTRQHLEVDEVVPIVRDIERFFKEEENLLVECGASGDPVAEIVADCRRVFEDVRNGQAPRGQVFEAIERITRKTCDLKERLKEKASQERKHEQEKKILGTAGKAIGGVAVVALNAGVFTTPEMQVFANFSAELGAGLILLAVQDLWTSARWAEG